MNLLELRAVSKTYRQGSVWRGMKRVKAVDGASLAIAAGECLALIGSSGSGKSTLGRLALGLERPDTGVVLFEGEEMNRLRGETGRRARRGIQVVFQNSLGSVNPRFTARDIVGEPLVYFDRMRGDALTRRVAELLDWVGIAPEAMGKLPHQFSGGELQRVCLARALAPAPRLFVLDEAVSSLDMLSQDLILGLLEKIRGETGAAFLFISHDLRVVGRMADRVAVMDKGVIVERTERSGIAGPDRLGSSPFRRLAEAVLPPGPREEGFGD